MSKQTKSSLRDFAVVGFGAMSGLLTGASLAFAIYVLT